MLCMQCLFAGSTRRPITHQPPLAPPPVAHRCCCSGEGWGLPVVEAMSMALPVLVTNYSGPTAYLDETVGYPLRWQLAQVPPGTGAFSGMLRAVRPVRACCGHVQIASVRGVPATAPCLALPSRDHGGCCR